MAVAAEEDDVSNLPPGRVAGDPGSDGAKGRAQSGGSFGGGAEGADVSGVVVGKGEYAGMVVGGGVKWGAQGAVSGGVATEVWRLWGPVGTVL